MFKRFIVTTIMVIAGVPSAFAQLFQFTASSQIQVLYPDLTSVMMVASLKGNQMLFNGNFQGGQDVRVLLSDQSTGQVLVLKATSLLEGDFLLHFPDVPNAISLRAWLQSYGLQLIMP